jgi:hypothetical protein
MSQYDDATHITNPSTTPVKGQYEQYVSSVRAKRAPVIDWDAASAAWKENKIRRGEMYYYRCTAIQRNGQQCSKPDLQPIAPGSHICKMHRRTTTQAPLQKENHLAAVTTHACVAP